jgi:hypothetical protein
MELPNEINELAKIIFKDWQKISPHAIPYLEAMTTLKTVNDKYGEDSAKSIIIYFLGNATGYRGEVAREVKKKLNQLIK